MKMLIDIDEEGLAMAQKLLKTTTAEETVNRAVRAVVVQAARNAEIDRLAVGVPDLLDPVIMAAAWLR